MSYLIKNAARKLADIATQKMYEVFLEKMIERGYDETNVKKIVFTSHTNTSLDCPYAYIRGIFKIKS